MTEPLAIDIQATPNPNAAKFTLNRAVAASGKTYREVATADAEWAKQLLQIAGVTQVFAVNNFISVSKTPDAEWTNLVPEIERILKRAFDG